MHRSRQCEIRFYHPRPGADAQLVDDLLQDRLQGDIGLASQRNPVAETAARKVQNIVDQARHPHDAAVHHAQNLRPPVAQGLLAKEAHAAANGGEGVAQIMTEHRDELLAERGCVLVIGVRGEVHADGAELEADHLREHFEHLDGFGGFQPMRFRIDGA